MIHEGYFGLGKCKLWHKHTVYWPGINEQLEKLVLNCELCLKYSKATKQTQAITPNMSLGQEIPIHPWTKVATIIFHFKNDLYLLMVDYTSRFPVVHKVTSTMAQQVASQMKLIFSEYGWPKTIVSDNSPCYSAEIFTKLMTDCSVNHITSSSHYPRSKGLAEKYVQVVKSLFYKAQDRRHRSLQKSNDMQKYPVIKYVAVTYADPVIMNCQNPTTNVQCGKSTTGTRFRATGSEQQKWTFTQTQLPYRPECYVSKPRE